MRAVMSSLCICLAIGSSGWLGAQEPAESSGFTIVIDPSAFADDNAELGAAWLLYATAIVTKASSPEFSDRPVDDYAIEAHARTELARHWLQRPRRERPQDPYLDKLVMIHDAGFVEEYVLAMLARPGWSVSAAELAALDLAEFLDWAPANLEGFRSVTLAGAEAKQPRPSAPTGAELPDTEGFVGTRAGCAASVASMRSALESWEMQMPALRGAPVAAASPGEFVAILAAVQAREPYRTRGVSLISERPAHWAFYAGFCGVEVGDLATARHWLELAVSALPLSFNVRHELIHVLVAEGRFDEADGQLDDILAVAGDDCTLARAWRRRGYIRFEQQKWDEARAAYLRSLEYDPGNQVALDELVLIERQVAPDDGELPASGPVQLVSHCTE